jgi:hypothetical protein
MEIIYSFTSLGETQIRMPLNKISTEADDRYAKTATLLLG